MVKHRRFSDNPKPDSIENEEISSSEISSSENSMDIKSTLLSGSKYVYIIAIAALLSGIFTPLTINAEITTVVNGMLSIFLGLGGGILIFLGIKNQKFSTVMVFSGFAILFASLLLIYEIAGKSLLW